MRTTSLVLFATLFIVYCESTRVRPVLKTYKVGLLRRYAPFRIRPAIRKRYYGYGIQRMPFYNGYGGPRFYGGYRPGMSYGTQSGGYSKGYGGGRNFMMRPYRINKSYGSIRKKSRPQRKVIPLSYGKKCGKYELLICKKYTKNRCFKICGYKGCQVKCTCSCQPKPRKIIRPQLLQKKQPLIPKRLISPPKHITQHINILPSKGSIPMCGKKTFLRCSAKKMSHRKNQDCSNTCMIKKICKPGCICECMPNTFLGQGIGVGGSGISGGVAGIGIDEAFTNGGLNGGIVNGALHSGFGVGQAGLSHLGGHMGEGGIGNGGLKEENIEVKIDVMSGGNGGGGIGAGVGISGDGLGVSPTLGVGIGGGHAGFGEMDPGIPVGILGIDQGFGGGADLSGLGTEAGDIGFGQGLDGNLGVGIDTGNHGFGGIVQDLGLQDLGGLNAFGLDGNAGIGIDGGEGLGNDLGMAGLGLDFGFGGTGNSGIGIDSFGLGGQGNIGVGVNDLGASTASSGVGVLGSGLGSPDLGMGGPGVGIGPDHGKGGPGVGIGPDSGHGGPGVGIAHDSGHGGPGVGIAHDSGHGGPGIGIGPDLGLGGGPGVGVGPDLGLGGGPGVGVGPDLGLGGGPGVGVGPDLGLGGGLGVGIGPDSSLGHDSVHGNGLGSNAGIAVDSGFGHDAGHGKSGNVGNPGVAVASNNFQGNDLGSGGGLDLSGIAPNLNLDLNGIGADAGTQGQSDPLVFQDPTLPPGGSNNIAVSETGMNNFGLFPDMGSPGFGLDMNPGVDFGQASPNDPLNFPL